jgi:arylsulfatase A-like enzyme
MCENIDANVGRILRKLHERKLADNTIVIYFSDNGPNSWRWNGGMRGRKGSTDEGGVRSPLLVRWPGYIKAGTKVTQIAAAIDLLPTLADLADIKVAGKPLDGVSLPASARQGQCMARSHDLQPLNGNVSVRTQQHRLDNTGRLYDLTKTGQERDLSRELPDVAKRLGDAVTA